jgi:hypothetical protein
MKQKRRNFSVAWNTLWVYSQSQVVTFACFATIAIPILAQLVIFVRLAQISAPIFDNTLTWKIFAAELYYAGLLIFTARSLVQIFCPKRIQRFQYEDQHFLYVTKVRTTTAELLKRAADPDEDEQLSGPQELTEAARRELNDAIIHPITAKKDWEKENLRLRPLRWIIAMLYGIGTVGVLTYLIIKAIENIQRVAIFAGLKLF